LPEKARAPIAAKATQCATGYECAEADPEELTGVAGAGCGALPARGFFLLLVNGYNETQGMGYEGDAKADRLLWKPGTKNLSCEGKRQGKGTNEPLPGKGFPPCSASCCSIFSAACLPSSSVLL
jgi:hypothetical protein